MISKFSCPSCYAPLREAVTRNGREVWCSNIACESLVADDPGGVGRNSQLAFDDLWRKVKAERDADNQDMSRGGA